MEILMIMMAVLQLEQSKVAGVEVQAVQVNQVHAQIFEEMDYY